MKKNTKVIAFLVIALALIGLIWYNNSKSPAGNSGTSSTTTPYVAESETTKVSGGLSEFQNAELGFSLKYPSTLELGKTDTGLILIQQIDKSQVTTVAKLQTDVSVVPGKCAFPPVTTIKERSKLVVKDKTYNMISMSNTVQGRTYFDRMYSLQKDNVCYFFTLATITLSPASKNYTGSNLTQAENNNKAIISSADAAFTEMVKSFEFVTGPQGVDETKASPAK